MASAEVSCGPLRETPLSCPPYISDHFQRPPVESELAQTEHSHNSGRIPENDTRKPKKKTWIRYQLAFPQNICLLSSLEKAI